MAINLAIEDAAGVIYPASHHIIAAVRTNGLEKTCQLKIQVYASQESFAAGKAPLCLSEWGRDFYMINIDKDDYLDIASRKAEARDVGAPVANMMLKAAYLWLMRQDKKSTQYFDYTNGVVT